MLISMNCVDKAEKITHKIIRKKLAKQLNFHDYVWQPSSTVYKPKENTISMYIMTYQMRGKGRKAEYIENSERDFTIRINLKTKEVISIEEEKPTKQTTQNKEEQS